MHILKRRKGEKPVSEDWSQEARKRTGNEILPKAMMITTTIIEEINEI